MTAIALSLSPLALMPHVALAPSPIHGIGLFATKPISAGMHLCTLDGQVIAYAHAMALLSAPEPTGQDRTGQEKMPDLGGVEWNFLPQGRILLRLVKTQYGFINHSRRPNLKLMGFPPQLWTQTDIALGDELTLDYRDEPLPADYLGGHGAHYL